MAFEAGGLEIDSQLINGGGLVKTIEQAKFMARTSVGAVLGGSFTLDSRVGNSPNGERVYYRDPITGVVYNALGMPNKGLRGGAAEDIAKMQRICHDLGKPFILNFAPVTNNPVDEIEEAFACLAGAGIEEVDVFEVNASCPNVPASDGSGRHEILSHHPERLGEVLNKVDELSYDGVVSINNIWARISPFRSEQEAADFVYAMDTNEAPVDALSAFNTFPVGPEGAPELEVPKGVGGMSGPGMTAKADAQTKWLDDVLSEQLPIDIIASNGVHDGWSMTKRMSYQNVKAVTITSELSERSPEQWRGVIHRILDEYTDIIHP